VRILDPSFEAHPGGPEDGSEAVGRFDLTDVATVAWTADGVRAGPGPASFVAVNADPAEGDLTPIPPDVWRAAWGAAPTPPDAWRSAIFPRRHGPELWPWALVLALAALAGEAALRRRT